jgi:hypothetical protein
MTMKLIFRQALDTDMVAVKEILGPWIREDPGIVELLDNVITQGSSSPARCRLLEKDDALQGVSLWIPERPDHVRLIAFGLVPEASETGADSRFLGQEIMEWAELGVSKVTVRVPEPLATSLVPCLRTCGFMLEGICSSCCRDAEPLITFSKHFLYKSIAGSEVLDFLQGFLLALGYEVRTEGDGISYRLRSEFRLPFIFSSWHRISRSGPDLVLQPPARVLEWSELENLFYPFRIQADTEKPLLVPLDRSAAAALIDLPTTNDHQNSLFARGGLYEPRTIRTQNLAYIDPTGVQGVRKGLPLLFYVNRVGAVGIARVQDWLLDDAKTLPQSLHARGWTVPGNLPQNPTASLPRSGKILAVRFHWYSALKRPVKLEDIRAMDRTFSPQRVRCLSSELFQSIVDVGRGIDPGASHDL